MKLSVKKRDIYGKKVKNLRAQGLVPAVIYGKHVEAESISCVKNDLLKVYKASGYSTPVELTGDVNHLVLINALQLDPTANLRRMSKGMKQKTALVVAFMHSPEIIILDEGRIAERGTHYELLKKQGLYYETYVSQYGVPDLRKEA